MMVKVVGVQPRAELGDQENRDHHTKHQGARKRQHATRATVCDMALESRRAVISIQSMPERGQMAEDVN